MLTRGCRMARQITVALSAVLFLPAEVAASPVTVAGNSSILNQCRQLSLEDNDIHNCLDNHLDAMDENLESILDVIRSELTRRAGSADTLQALENSQRAFETFRTDNCLWYLAFSSPRSLAEQIAKNCLATMSEQRLAELQRLLKTADEPANVQGYYVYGANRNTYVPCGSDRRYWVEGDNSVVGALQQRYLNEATLRNQLLFVEFAGEIDASESDAIDGHDGVFQLQSAGIMRAPTDGDCAPPVAGQSATAEVSDTETSAEVAVESGSDDLPSDQQSAADQEPEQSLTAYFSDWTASCKQLGSSYGCELSAPHHLADSETGAEQEQQQSGLLRVTRRSGQRTIVDVELPDPFVDLVSDVDQIQWRVDAIELGKLLHSQLAPVEGTGERQGKAFLRQALRERWFIRDRLLPVLFRGNELIVAVQPPGQTLTELNASLVGLTRAIAFADDFTAAEGEVE